MGWCEIKKNQSECYGGDAATHLATWLSIINKVSIIETTCTYLEVAVSRKMQHVVCTIQ